MGRGGNVVVDSVTGPGQGKRKVVVAAACAVFLLTASVAGQIRVLHLWGRDLAVPFMYTGDAVMAAVAIKNLAERGWIYDEPLLGLPGTMNTRDYPSDDGAHWIALRILAWFTPSWGAAMNLYFILGCSLSALTSWLVMRRLRIARLPAVFASLLFAFLPYHFIRGEAHLFLGAYYVVPVAAYLALRVMEEEPLFHQRREAGRLRQSLGVAGIILSCALIGSSGVYYAFFSCFLLTVGAALSALKRRTARNLVGAGIAVGLIVAAVGLNLLPSIRYRREHGVDPAVAARVPAEAETYGLKLAQLVLPLTGHRFKEFARLKNIYNSTPLVNENDAATLGLLGSIGFLLLLLRLVFKWRDDERAELWESLSSLNFAILLLGVMGGFGSLFAFLVTPQLRCYNRVSIFIGFFSLTAVAMLLGRLTARFERSFTGARVGIAGMLCGLALFGLYDQTSPVFAAGFDSWAAEYRHDEAYVKSLEASLPAGARIFELPYFPFPEEPPHFNLPDYGLARPYLHSSSLRWSYGATRGRETDLWQQQVTSKTTADMLEALALSGFDALYIDRWGYGDGAVALEARISGVLKLSPLVSANRRMAVFNLGPFANLLQERYPPEEFALRRDLARYPLLLTWGNGFHDQEGQGDSTWRWSMGQSELVLYNLSDRPLEAVLDLVVLAGGAGPSSLTVSEGGSEEAIQITGKGTPYSKKIRLPPGRHVVSLSTDARPIEAPGDPRVLVFRLASARLHRVQEANLPSPGLAWILGCFALEGGPGLDWRWCRGRGELMLDNPWRSPARLRLSTRLSTGYSKPATVIFESDVLSGAVAVTSAGTLFEKELVVPPGQHLIRFHADARRVRAPGDPREMVLRFENAHVERVP